MKGAEKKHRVWFWTKTVRKICIDNSTAKFVSPVIQIYLAGLAIANSFEKNCFWLLKKNHVACHELDEWCRALKHHALSMRLTQTNSTLCSHIETIISHALRFLAGLANLRSFIITYLLWYNLILVRFVLASTTCAEPAFNDHCTSSHMLTADR